MVGPYFLLHYHLLLFICICLTLTKQFQYSFILGTIFELYALLTRSRRICIFPESRGTTVWSLIFRVIKCSVQRFSRITASLMMKMPLAVGSWSKITRNFIRIQKISSRGCREDLIMIAEATLAISIAKEVVIDVGLGDVTASWWYCLFILALIYFARMEYTS